MTTTKPHPQRLTPAAPPGSLLKRLHTASVHHKLERAKELAGRDEAYLALVRQCPCLKCGLDPCGEAAHIRRQSAAHGKFGGMQKKPPDRFALPLDPGCHREDRDSLHKTSEGVFFHLLGIDPLWACERLYAARGDVVAMRAVVFQIIGERKS